MAEKPKLAVYWASSCGGCEISLVNIHEKILDVAAGFDLIFCPCLMDTKKKDIEAMPDKSIALTLFNGAIRNTENEEMARLMRRKSQLLIAFGSCAKEGCIPALANLHSREELLWNIYMENPTVDNPEAILPAHDAQVGEGELPLPEFFQRVRSLAQTVKTDYFIPGCPPESHQIWNVIDAVLKGSPLPPAGSVIGAGCQTVCEECSRTKNEKKIDRLYRVFEIVPDKVQCLLEQGIICMGIATRNGCGALCPQVNMPCTGCYGCPEDVADQGAKMVSALGSILTTGSEEGLTEEELAVKATDAVAAIPDLAGTFYRYSLAESILRGARDKQE